MFRNFHDFQPKSYPNKLLVSFDFVEEMFSEKFRAATQRPVEANYNVMDTDYQNYAIGKILVSFLNIFINLENLLPGSE